MNDRYLGGKVWDFYIGGYFVFNEIGIWKILSKMCIDLCCRLFMGGYLCCDIFFFFVFWFGISWLSIEYLFFVIIKKFVLV